MTNGPEAATSKPGVYLVPLDPVRDAEASLDWGEPFNDDEEAVPLREALTPRDYATVRRIKEETLQISIDNPRRIVWAIRSNVQTIGIAEVDLSGEYVDGPLVDVTIGERDRRREGIGSAALQGVLQHLRAIGYGRAYGAYREGDELAAAFSAKNGFTPAHRFVHGYEDTNPDAYVNVPFIVPFQSVMRELE